MDNVLLRAMRDAGIMRGKADAEDIVARAVSGEADGPTLVEERAKIPTWTPRDYRGLPVGTPRRWPAGGNTVYKLWQQHDATGNESWNPADAVSLWDICHTTDPALATEYVAPQGTRGLYQVNECCIWEGRVKRNNYPDNAYDPATLPERWDDLGAVADVQLV